MPLLKFDLSSHTENLALSDFPMSKVEEGIEHELRSATPAL